MDSRLSKVVGKELLGASREVLDAIVEFLKDDLRGIQKNKVDQDNYNHPSWAYEQADYNGRVRELMRVIKLLGK